MFFTDYLNNYSISLLRQSERDGLYSPWSAEFDFSVPEEPLLLILRCVRCGCELFDLTGLDNRQQRAGVLSKPDLFQKFHIAEILVPIREHEPLEVLSCEDCRREVSDPKNFERVRFANLCWAVRAAIGMKKDETALKIGVRDFENLGLDFSQIQIAKEN